MSVSLSNKNKEEVLAALKEMTTTKRWRYNFYTTNSTIHFCSVKSYVITLHTGMICKWWIIINYHLLPCIYIANITTVQYKSFKLSNWNVKHSFIVPQKENFFIEEQLRVRWLKKKPCHFHSNTENVTIEVSPDRWHGKMQSLQTRERPLLQLGLL